MGLAICNKIPRDGLQKLGGMFQHQSEWSSIIYEHGANEKFA